MINGTLIIQIINFWIGYFILKNILLRPALNFVRKQDKEKSDLLSAISYTSKEIEKRTNIKNKEWAECLEYLKKRKPYIKLKKREKFEVITITPLPKEFFEEKGKLIITMKNKIISVVTRSFS